MRYIVNNMANESVQQTTKSRQIIASLSAAGGAFAVGAALGWSSPAASRLVPHNPQYFPITASEFDTAASIITLGMLISCLPVGYLMKLFGRKWTMMGLVVPFLIGWGLVIWAKSYAMLVTGRIFIGLAGGAFCVSAPQYSSEIAEKDVRGLAGTFFQLLMVTGILFTYIIGAVIPIYYTGLICGAIPIIFAVIFFFMPESPVYLVLKGRDEDAIKSFKWLRGEFYNPQTEIDELKLEMTENQNNQVSLMEVLKKKATKKALIIGFGLMLFQQLSGINVVIFYVSNIFQAAKSSLDSDLSSIIVGAVHVGATFLSTMLVDRLGRKILLLMSIIVLTITLIALGVFFFIEDNYPESADSIGWLPLVSLSIYIIFFALGFGPVPWLMISEVYTKEYNAIASPISGAFNWGLAFIVTLTFRPISDAVGIGETFWGFAVICIVGTFFTFILVPETKGKTMTEVQNLLSGERSK